MPDGEEVKRQPFRFADPRQEKIHLLLTNIGSGPPAFYQDACRLMSEQPQYASTSHLVSHLLREIDSALRKVLETGSDQQVEGKNGHEKSIKIVLNALEIPESEPVAQEWLRFAGNDDYGLDKRAHRSALSVRPVNEEFMEMWDRMQIILDVVLSKFEDRFLTWVQKIDSLALKEKPTRADVSFLCNHLPNNRAALGTFYDKLTSPAWIKPLAEEHQFSNPPQPVHDAEKGTIGYSVWPQSRYLARMASIAPDEVFHIIEAVPETQNFLVHMDFANAVWEMPPATAAKLLPKMKTWIESGDGTVTDKLGQVMEMLAEGGEHQAALELGRMLLEIGTRGSDGRLLHQGGTSLWHYERTLAKYSRVVTKVGEPALTLLCELLDKAIDDSRFSIDKRHPYDDSSTQWRPAIEVAPYVAMDIRSHLVSAIRDAATKLAQNDPTIVPHLVKAFRKRRKMIFRRLAHFLLHSFPAADPVAIEQTLLSRGMLLKADRWHEYSLLMRDCFKLLSPANREKVLMWIDEGPDRKRLTRRYEQFYGKPVEAEHVEAHIREWKKQHVALLASDLPPSWREKFAEFLTPLLPEQQLDNAVQVNGGAFVGRKSPDEAKNLSSQSVDAVIELLKSWKPSGDWMAGTMEGLASDLQHEVGNSPARFAAEAVKFQTVRPVYISGLADGLQEAVKNGATFDWKPVVELSRWVTSQPASKLFSYPPTDGGWYMTRTTIAKLFSEGFNSTTAAIPFDLRYDAWAVMDRLIHPSLVPEKPREAGADEHPHHSSTDRQTASPEPLLAVLRYALWSRRMLQAQGGEPTTGQGWLDKMPEVALVLSEQLKPENSPITSAHRVVGEQLGNLFGLDPNWVSNHLLDIFPDSGADLALGETAWANYLFSWNPGSQLFDCLRPLYLRAIERINEAPVKTHFPQDSNERLADHLMMMYWNGHLSLDDELLRNFFANASDKIRGHALHMIGFSVHSYQGDLEPAITARLQSLFDARLQAGKTGEPAKHEAELAAFGWWFESEQFDLNWSMRVLLEVLTLVGKIEVAHLVVERLAELSAQMPEDCAKCISLLCDGLSDTFEIQGWEKHQRTILNNAIQSGNATARKEAIALINRLASRGYSAFADLIPRAAA
jgi:hypothetical protein